MVYDRLIAAAIDHFGRLGFEGASTRAIAAASGTAMSSITYHFGGKEGLYLAVADHIAEQIAARQQPVLAALRGGAIATREQAVEGLLAMVDAFARMMMAPESAAWSSFIMREQQQPTAAFERIYAGAMAAIVETFTTFITIARPDLTDREARMTGVFLYGQAVILRVGFASVCRVLEIDGIDSQTEAQLLVRLRATTLSVLSEKPE
ncbi:MAG TPA: CerR family C-terminal domain-containing protein [Sphingobium sp.]